MGAAPDSGVAPGTPKVRGSAGPRRSPTACEESQAARWSGVPSAHQLGGLPSLDWAHQGTSAPAGEDGEEEGEAEGDGVGASVVGYEVDVVVEAGSAWVWGVHAVPSHQRRSLLPPGSAYHRGRRGRLIGHGSSRCQVKVRLLTNGSRAAKQASAPSGGHWTNIVMPQRPFTTTIARPSSIAPVDDS